MKTSPAGKLLGPQSDAYEVIYDGDSLPMIATPGGRILRLQQLHYGKWDSPAMGAADTKFFVEAANLLRDCNKAERVRAEKEEKRIAKTIESEGA